MVALLLLVLSAGQGLAAETVRIGTFLAITGPAAFTGAPALATLRMMAEDVNAHGGVAGRKIELIYYDTGVDARAAQTAVRRLIDEDRVDLIIGGSTASAAQAVIPLVEEAKIPFIALAGATAIVEPVRKWVFKTGLSDRLACARILLDMRKRGIERIAMVSESAGLGAAMRRQCLDLAPRLGVTVIVDQTFTAGSRRLDGPIREIAKRSGMKGGLQAVLVAGFGSGPIFFTQAYAKAGLTPVLYHSHGTVVDELIDRAGKAADGVRLPVALLDLVDRLPPGDLNRRRIQAYRAAFKKRWEVPPTVFGGVAYDAMRIALAAVRRAHGINASTLRREIERTNGYIGVTGVYRYSQSDHGGLSLAAFRMVEVSGGDWLIRD